MIGGIRFGELLRYNSDEVRRWRDWFAKQPAEALQVPVGATGGETADVRGMLRHIFLTELFYAELLAGKKASDYRALPHHSLDEIFAIGERAEETLGRYLATVDDDELKTYIMLPFRKDDPIRGTKRKMLAHVFLHSVRHWSQVATALRQHGYKHDWQHDLVFSDALE